MSSFTFSTLNLALIAYAISEESSENSLLAHVNGFKCLNASMTTVMCLSLYSNIKHACIQSHARVCEYAQKDYSKDAVCMEITYHFVNYIALYPPPPPPAPPPKKNVMVIETTLFIGVGKLDLYNVKSRFCQCCRKV